jgi:hypothetical protein
LGAAAHTIHLVVIQLLGSITASFLTTISLCTHAINSHIWAVDLLRVLIIAPTATEHGNEMVLATMDRTLTDL